MRYRHVLGALVALGVVLLALAGRPASAAPPAIGGCQVFPADNVWNTRIDTLPLDARSGAYVSGIGSGGGLKADFGKGLWNGGPIGIPYTTASATQARVPISFDYDDESDPGPYPIPPNPPIEGGGDRHVLVVQQGACRLYETWDSWPQGDGSWHAGSGAVFDLTSNALRPNTWTSADAAGLPILPGLVRYDEVASGQITHALRFTVPRTRRAYVWPARHYASSYTDTNLPPMGQRFRLKASFDISGFSATNRVILTALKTYGMFLADNGSAWYLSGVPDERWNNSDLALLQSRVHGSDFEVVDESSLMVSPDSGQARQPAVLAPDANGDGVVNATDSLCILRQVSGLAATSACPRPLPRGDVNGDGTVTAVDSLCVLRVIAGLPPTAGCPTGVAGATTASTPSAVRSPRRRRGRPRRSVRASLAVRGVRVG